MNTFSDVIAAFGGPARFAEAIGIDAGHGQSMKNRDSIPPGYWAETIAAAERLDIAGVTTETLMDIARMKRDQHREREQARA